jgi:hypothetical protein
VLHLGESALRQFRDVQQRAPDKVLNSVLLFCKLDICTSRVQI